MAVVYRGVDLTLNRPVAVKVMHSHLLRRADARERFCREARVIAKLKHENIVEVYDYSGNVVDPSASLSEDAMIVTELVDGVSLAEHMTSCGPMLPEMAAMVTSVVARALDHAHANGVVHRDIKPENIMIGADGVLKLMDFGIAHVMDMEHLTVTGAIVGSPAHMSPEQVDGKALDARTDIFSLGTLLFLLSSGTFPFSSDTPSGLLRAIAEARTPDIRTRVKGFPDDIYAILTKMMARDATRRYQTAGEVADALEAVLESVGIGPIRGEMKQFFGDPHAQAPLLRHRVSVGRVRLGQKYLAAGRKAKAIREADTAVLTDPSCDEAIKFIEVVRRSIRVSKVLKIILAVAVVAVVVLIGVMELSGIRNAIDRAGFLSAPAECVSLPGRPAEMPVPVRRGIDNGTGGVSALSRGLTRAKGGLAVASTDAVSSAGVDEKGAVVSAPGDAPLRFPVSIQAYPPAVRIRLDGRQVGVGRVEALPVEPGRHQIDLSHPSCDQCRDVSTEIIVDPDNPPKATLRLSIAYRDARLIVSGPPGGNVYLNNESVPRGTTNASIMVSMDRPTPVDMTVRVVMEGHPDFSDTVRLQAGKASAVRIGR